MILRRPRTRRHPGGLPVRRYAVLLFLLTVALVGAVALTLDRNVRHSTLAQHETALGGASQVAAASIGTLRSNLRVQASQIATSLPLQRAIVTGNHAALEEIAATHHARLRLRTGIVGKIAPAPRLESSASITDGPHVLAQITVAAPLGDDVLAVLRQTTPLPRGAALLFVRNGRIVAGAHRGTVHRLGNDRLAIGKTTFAARSAPLGVAGVSVVAVEPAAAIDAASHRYRQLIFMAALVTLILMGALARRLARPLAQVVTDVGRLARQAQTDALTGVANRRALDDRLVLELDRAAQTEGAVSYVMADIDDFKPINDVHGHQTGDVVLRAVAQAVQGTVRETDFVARYGGEELAIILPGISLAAAREAAERMRHAVEAVAVTAPDGSVLRVTASFGAASYPTYPSVEAIVGGADAALYQAKRNGKNRVATATIEGEAEPAVAAAALAVSA